MYNAHASNSPVVAAPRLRGGALAVLATVAALTGCFDSGPERPKTTYSPSGEPLVGGGWPADCSEALARWFDRADSNRDGVLTLSELMADAERQFQVMDTRQDGKLTAASLAAYRQQIIGAKYNSVTAADAAALNGLASDREGRENGFPQDKKFGRTLSRADLTTRLPSEQPDPVMSADTDLDGSVTWDEFRTYMGQVFIELDRKRAGGLTKADIQTFCETGRY